MDSTDRLTRLERSLRRTQILLAGAVVALLVLLGAQWWQHLGRLGEVRTHRLVVIDDHGVTRVELGQDPPQSLRRSRSAGLWLFDASGHERGGMSTFEDGSVAAGLDAPFGVGTEPHDRLGLSVDADGSAQLLLTDNRTGGVVRLISHGDGSGGVQTIKADLVAKKILVRTMDYDGDQRAAIPMSQP